MDKPEHWRQVPNEPFIEASTLGRLRRLDRVMEVAPRNARGQNTGNFRALAKGGPVSPWMDKATGYLRVSWCIDGVTRKQTIHRLIALTFVDGWFDGATVDHLDMNKLNNAADNLEWVTLAENSKRQNEAGRGVPKGEFHPSAKLLDKDIPELFRLRSEGLSLSKISAMYGVSMSLVQKITSGQRRGHK